MKVPTDMLFVQLTQPGLRLKFALESGRVIRHDFARFNNDNTLSCACALAWMFEPVVHAGSLNEVQHAECLVGAAHMPNWMRLVIIYLDDHVPNSHWREAIRKIGDLTDRSEALFLDLARTSQLNRAMLAIMFEKARQTYSPEMQRGITRFLNGKAVDFKQDDNLRGWQCRIPEFIRSMNPREVLAEVRLLISAEGFAELAMKLLDLWEQAIEQK